MTLALAGATIPALRSWNGLRRGRTLRGLGDIFERDLHGDN